MKNKIAIILGSNIHWAPYYYRYEKILNEMDIKFDLIYWNREQIKEETSAHLIQFNIKDKSNNKNPFKLWKFVSFSKYVKKIIKENKYDKLIFLGTHGCAVSFCANYLASAYKNKIWIDIRDDEYEWFPPFYWGEKKSIDVSYATVISSYEYKRFLPKHDYLYIHNIDPNADKIIQEYKKLEDNQNRVRLSFIGNVRYYDQNIKIINRLGNDQRFLLQYFGNGSETLKKYCNEKKIDNVKFHGAFPQKDTINFYNETDVINNAYGNETLNLQTALSNKLYYSLMFKMPILVSKDTFMEKITKQYRIGYTFEDTSDFADNFYEWYEALFNKRETGNYNDLWNKVKKEDEEAIRYLKSFIRE